MGNVAAYKRPDVKGKLLQALREGKSRTEAAGVITTPVKTLLGWIERDDGFRHEVETAEFVGRELAEQRRAEEAATVKRVDKTGADKFARLREDAAKFAPGMLGFLLAVDARVSAIPGNPPMSPFFRHAFAEFYAGEYHEFLCVGARGMGKSTNQIKVAATELVFRDRHIPPMDPRWIWPFMSHNMAESNQRVQPFKRTLQAIGYGDSDLVVYDRKDGRSEIQFDDAKGQPVKINIFPNTADACRGGNLCGATDDEEMHWIASKSEGLSKADDVLKVLVGALRADRSRVHIRISSVNDAPSAMLEAAKRGSTSLRYVATLGPFLRDAVDGFERVATHLDTTNRRDESARVRKWASTLTAESPWIPSWVGNPTHDPVEGFDLLFDKLRDGQDKIGTWLQENGSCPWPLEFVEGNYFEAKQIDGAVNALRIDTMGAFVYKQAANTRDHFAAIDTGAKKNPSALCIVERVKVGARYQWRPVVLREWRRTKGGLPLDLRGVVLPQMASILREYGCASWWSDGWAGDAVEIVGAQNGIMTTFVSTSTATRDIYEPLDLALGQTPCSVVLSGCENVGAAVAQLRQVKRANDGSAVVPHDGSDHGELGQVLARALAHAGVGQTPPDDERGWRSFGSDRGDDWHEMRRE